MNEFEAAVQSAVADCVGRGVEVVFVDCGEEPCVAAIAYEDHAQLSWLTTWCPYWDERFPATDSVWDDRSVLCADGGAQPVAVVGMWPDRDRRFDMDRIRREREERMRELAARQLPPVSQAACSDDRPLVPFPADLPPELGPAGFEGAIRHVMETCEPPGWELLSTDCRELPCFSVFREDESSSGKHEFPHDCGAWRRTFGDGVTGAEWYVSCDGHTERAHVIAPPRTWRFVPSGVPSGRIAEAKARADATWPCRVIAP